MQLGKHDVPWLPLHALREQINFRHFWATTALKTERASCQTYLTPTRTFSIVFYLVSLTRRPIGFIIALHARVLMRQGQRGKERGGKVELHTVSASAQIRRRIWNSVGLTDCSCVHSALTTPEWLRRGCLKTLAHTRSLRSCLFLRCLI